MMYHQAHDIYIKTSLESEPGAIYIVTMSLMLHWCFTNVTGKNYRFSVLVFQDNTSKNQDFFMTFSAPMSNFRTFQVLKNEKSNFRTFSGLFRSKGEP